MAAKKEARIPTRRYRLAEHYQITQLAHGQDAYSVKDGVIDLPALTGQHWYKHLVDGGLLILKEDEPPTDS
jgi:hypothetical protein